MAGLAAATAGRWRHPWRRQHAAVSLLLLCLAASWRPVSTAGEITVQGVFEMLTGPQEKPDVVKPDVVNDTAAAAPSAEPATTVDTAASAFAPPPPSPSPPSPSPPPAPPADWAKLEKDCQLLFKLDIRGSGFLPFTANSSAIVASVLRQRYLRSTGEGDIRIDAINTYNFQMSDPNDVGVPDDEIDSGIPLRRRMRRRSLQQAEKKTGAELAVVVTSSRVRVESEQETLQAGVMTGQLAVDLTAAGIVTDTVAVLQAPCVLELSVAIAGGKDTAPNWVTFGLNAGGNCSLCANPMCMACSGDFKKCSKCMDGSQLWNGDCVMGCNVPGCAKCRRDGSCKACDEGYTRRGNQCIECKIKHCSTCNASGDCKMCKLGYARTGKRSCSKCRTRFCSDCGFDPRKCLKCATGYRLTKKRKCIKIPGKKN